MPKKTRKMKQRAAERRGMQSAPPEVGAVKLGMPAAESPVRTRPEFAAAKAVTPLTYDYSYIYGDLRRIALFAGFFFVVLVALSFIIK